MSEADGTNSVWRLDGETHRAAMRSVRRLSGMARQDCREHLEQPGQPGCSAVAEGVSQVLSSADSLAAGLRGRVLVAEDESVFRRVLGFTLRRAGWDVVSVADGRAAWAQLRAGRFAALVTDYQMPGGGGLELLERLRASHLLSSLPTILCTGKRWELDRDVMLERYGLLAVLAKPFSPQQLVDLLDVCLPVTEQASMPVTEQVGSVKAPAAW